MKLGMPLLYQFETIEENLILAKKLNLDFIELNLNFGYCRNEMESKKVFDLLQKYNIEATLHFYDEADFGSYDEVVNAYLKLLKKYAKLGKGYIKIINIHNIPGPVVTISGVKNYIYDKEYEIYIDRLVDNLKKAEKICNKYNIKMVIENTKTPNFMLKTYKDLYYNNFKFNYDIGHDFNDNEMISNIIKAIPLKFDEFHIHDANKTKDHLALNEGLIDIKKFKDLAVLNDAYVVLEVKNQEDLEKSVPIFRNL